MGRWDYTNVYAKVSAKDEGLINKIFEYLGFDYANGSPDHRVDVFDGDRLNYCSAEMTDFTYEYEEIFALINALIPNTEVVFSHCEGNTVSDDEHEERVTFSPEDNTVYYSEKAGGYNGEYGHKNDSYDDSLYPEDPSPQMLSELIEKSDSKSDTKFRNMLLELAYKLNYLNYLDAKYVKYLAKKYKIDPGCRFIGKYSQKATNKKSPIMWLELEKTDDSVLLISKDALDYRVFGGENWENSALRKWLNGEFFDTVFDADEKEMILDTVVPSKGNAQYHTAPGGNTTDKVFLLSATEARRYFAKEAERCVKPSEHAIKQSGTKQKEDTNGVWILRTPGISSGRAVIVDDKGKIFNFGLRSGYIRPVIRIREKK